MAQRTLQHLHGDSIIQALLGRIREFIGRYPFRSQDPYDLQTIEVMRRLLRPDSNCIDVGANEGTILREMVRLAPLGSHIAIEPLPHLARRLRRRFPSVRVEMTAVADSTGESDFCYVQRAPGYSGLRRRIYPWPDPRIEQIRAKLARLDDLLIPIRAVRFIKIDIEGGEYHALLGAPNVLMRHRPVILFEAGWQSTGEYGITPRQMYQLVVEEYGYELSTMTRWLAGATPLSLAEFSAHWESGTEWMFLATPAGE